MHVTDSHVPCLSYCSSYKHFRVVVEELLLGEAELCIDPTILQLSNEIQCWFCLYKDRRAKKEWTRLMRHTWLMRHDEDREVGVIGASSFGVDCFLLLQSWQMRPA